MKSVNVLSECILYLCNHRTTICVTDIPKKRWVKIQSKHGLRKRVQHSESDLKPSNHLTQRTTAEHRQQQSSDRFSVVISRFDDKHCLSPLPRSSDSKTCKIFFLYTNILQKKKKVVNHTEESAVPAIPKRGDARAVNTVQLFILFSTIKHFENTLLRFRYTLARQSFQIFARFLQTPRAVLLMLISYTRFIIHTHIYIYNIRVYMYVFGEICRAGDTHPSAIN